MTIDLEKELDEEKKYLVALDLIIKGLQNQVQLRDLPPEVRTVLEGDLQLCLEVRNAVVNGIEALQTVISAMRALRRAIYPQLPIFKLPARVVGILQGNDDALNALLKQVQVEGEAVGGRIVLTDS